MLIYFPLGIPNGLFIAGRHLRCPYPKQAVCSRRPTLPTIREWSPEDSHVWLARCLNNGGQDDQDRTFGLLGTLAKVTQHNCWKEAGFGSPLPQVGIQLGTFALRRAAPVGIESASTSTGFESLCNYLYRHRKKKQIEACRITFNMLCYGKQKKTIDIIARK